jgi:RNA polymerase sigma-70 factor (ECF subfamily)
MDLKFQDVYDEYHNRIHHYLGQMAGETEAEDLTQEVFLKVNKGLDRFKGGSKLSTWVYRIATNTALDRLRSVAYRQGKREMPLSREDGETDTDSPHTTASPAEEVVREEMDECILEFVDRLPPDYRTVIVLSELKELKNREIAEILGISLDAVKIRLHRARQRLRKEFEAGCDLYSDRDGELSCDRKA